MTALTSRARVIVFTLVALAFIAGASAGFAGERLMVGKTIRVRAVHDMDGVLDRLGLTPEQRRVADSIVARSAPRAEAIILEVGERLRAVSDSVDAELRSVLTPNQRIRLDSMRSGSPLLVRRKVRPGGVTTVDTLFDSTAKRR